MEYKKMVSVAIITYQHINYIEQTIKSVLMQETSYDYEIVIADDCSTDGTREIVQKYKEMYPEKIRLVLHSENVGMVKNEASLLSACEGKYIAYLDGDDYWTDPHKLQIQIDFLENNNEYSSCYSDAQCIGDYGEEVTSYKVYKNDISDYKFFYEGVPTIPTSSFVIRNIFLNTDYIKYYSGMKYITDRISFCLALKHGKIGYIDRKMVVYRFFTHGKSFSSNKILIQKIDYVTCLDVQLNIVPEEVREIVEKQILNHEKEIAEEALEKKLYKTLINFLMDRVKSEEEKINI